MVTRYAAIILMVIVSLTVVACGPGEPIAVSTSSVATSVAATSTDTPIPSDDAPVQDSNTPILPTVDVNPPTATSEPTVPLAGLSQGVIAFYSNRDGNAEIYLVEAAGGNLRRLTDNSAGDMAPAVSPDGQRIAFTSNRDGNNEIYVMNADGSAPQRLTNNSVYESHPAWSPDAGPGGEQIAFVSERDGNREIYVIDADGSNPRRLTDDPADDMRPSWSPDGAQIAFNSERDGNWEIYVMNSDGSDLRRLTDSPAWEIFPAWSPDGTQIAYRHSAARDWNGDVWVMDADGNNKQQLTHESSNDENPNWSPDGSQIVFQSDRYAEPGTMGSDTYNFELVVMDADGSNARRLTDYVAGDYWPSWGPLAIESSTQVPTGAPTDEPTALPTSDDPPGIASLHDTWNRPTDEMVMVYVPAGTFQMGSDTNDANANDDEFPQHPVTLDGFWLDRTEVTNARYALCVADGDCGKATYADDADFNGADYPVAGVSWVDAAAYCAWAGTRLPTEAEWEYAARGTQGSIYPWGDDFDCSRGNFREGCDGYARTAPVGSFPSGVSWCGALDMAGNVWEWVADWDSDYASEAQTNPTGPTMGTRKIFRSSSFNYGPSYARTAHRSRHHPDGRSSRGGYVGFRCAASAGDTSAAAGPVVSIPQGPPPTLDGALEADEWAAALPDKMSDGSELFLMHDGEYLYVGIRASAPGSGVGSICIDRGEQVAILHSSAALGTSIYEKDGAEWQQTQEFVWQCRDTGNSAAAQEERREFLQAEGWLANNGLMGVPEEVEYQLAIPKASVRLAVTFLGPPGFDSVAAWPQDLSDGCQNINLITGPIPERLKFAPQTWITLSPVEEP